MYNTELRTSVSTQSSDILTQSLMDRLTAANLASDSSLEGKATPPKQNLRKVSVFLSEDMKNMSPRPIRGSESAVSSCKKSVTFAQKQQVKELSEESSQSRGLSESAIESLQGTSGVDKSRMEKASESSFKQPLVNYRKKVEEQAISLYREGENALEVLIEGSKTWSKMSSLLSIQQARTKLQSVLGSSEDEVNFFFASVYESYHQWKQESLMMHVVTGDVSGFANQQQFNSAINMLSWSISDENLTKVFRLFKNEQDLVDYNLFFQILHCGDGTGEKPCLPDSQNRRISNVGLSGGLKYKKEVRRSVQTQGRKSSALGDHHTLETGIAESDAEFDSDITSQRFITVNKSFAKTFEGDTN